MFTNQEIDLLFEALDAWERGDSGGRIVQRLMAGLLAKNEEQKKEFERDCDKEEAAAEAAKKLRKERALVLKFKLLQIRDGQDADRLLKDAKCEGFMTAT